MAAKTSTNRPPAAPQGLPIMKWVGGKKRLLPHILPHFNGQKRVVEPFFGGGAVSFALAAQHPGLRVVANDFLSPVMAIYEAVREDVEGFITEVDEYAAPYLRRRMPGRRKYYYEVRQRYMQQEIDGPAPLFFMLWCAYSGMYRTGMEYPGRFNTSHGFGSEKAGFYHPERLRSAALTMRNWTLMSGDFTKAQRHVTKDSFVFLDPPYRETYEGYTGEGFGPEKHLEVIEFFKKAASKGAKVVYTNKYTDDGYYEDHFKSFNITRVPIRYQVNRNCAEVGRPMTYEVLITS
jgi:DNA adenine methylase